MCGSEGLCPHCKYKNICGDSTYHTNLMLHKVWKEGQKELTGGSEDWNKIGCGMCPSLTYSIVYCPSPDDPDRKYVYCKDNK